MDTRFNPVLASGYSSRSQIARVLTEDWVERELYCLSCRSEELEPTRKNTKSRDFRCRDCSEPYELKSAARSFGGMVLDGAFETMRSTVLQGRSPNLLLLEYDRPSLSVTNLHAVHRGFLTPSEIVPRRAPLPQTARRAGWRGCAINLSALPLLARIAIVLRGRPRPPVEVQREYERFAFMIGLPTLSKGWLSDTLSIVERLPGPGPFRLEELYDFEEQLVLLHPGNRNIRPKIRQQLQVLVRRGVIRRLEPGIYERASAGTEGSVRAGRDA